MAASDVQIANIALQKLGAQAINDFSDDSDAARLADLTYAELRDVVLREHPWNFAMKRAALAALVDVPAWGYARLFQLPTDCLRVFAIDNPNREPWKVEGLRIATDLAAPLNILYVAQVTDPTQFDVLFREALSARLAMEWAETLTGTSTLQVQMAQLYARKIQDARGVDGQEGSVEQWDVFEWVESRFTGSSSPSGSW